MSLLAAAALAVQVQTLPPPQVGGEILWGQACLHDHHHFDLYAQDQDPPEQKLSKEEERHLRDIQNDIKKGAEFTAEIEKELKFSSRDDYIKRVETIGAELARVANQNKVEVTWGDPRLNVFPYQFKVVEGKDVNAFCVPGGYIYIYEGLIEFCESDDELAGVMAHEISHASFRHYATMQKEMTIFDKIQLPLVLAAILSRDPNVMAAVDATRYAAIGMQSGWSVKAETAADNGALQYLALTKYNPVGMLTMMERLAYRDNNSPQFDLGIFQTHPYSPERASNLQNRLQTMNVPIRRSLTSSSLRAEVRPTDEGRIEVFFGETIIHGFGGTDAIRRADSAVIRLNAFYDSVPDLFELRRSKNEIVGQGRVLFDVRPEDVGPGETTESTAEQILLRMKTLLYGLKYRLWKNN